MTASHTYKQYRMSQVEEGQPSSNLELIHFISKGDCKFPVMTGPGKAWLRTPAWWEGWIIGVQHKYKLLTYIILKKWERFIIPNA